jgi:hypothetical protein
MGGHLTSSAAQPAPMPTPPAAHCSAPRPSRFEPAGPLPHPACLGLPAPRGLAACRWPWPPRGALVWSWHTAWWPSVPITQAVFVYSLRFLCCSTLGCCGAHSCKGPALFLPPSPAAGLLTEQVNPSRSTGNSPTHLLHVNATGQLVSGDQHAGGACRCRGAWHKLSRVPGHRPGAPQDCSQQAKRVREAGAACIHAGRGTHFFLAGTVAAAGLWAPSRQAGHTPERTSRMMRSRVFWSMSPWVADTVWSLSRILSVNQST